MGNRFLDALPEDGERRLMLAVLIDAIRALRIERSTAPHIHTYRAWLRDQAWMQAEDRSQPFSFVSICDALGLDASYVRRSVLRPSDSHRPAATRRYAIKAKESWMRQGANAKSSRESAAAYAQGGLQRRK